MKFEQQVDYFRKKLNVATNSYQDVWGEEHDYLFMVAGAHRNDMVADLRRLVDKVIADGLPFEQFKTQFAELAAQYNWAFNGGLNWRARIIYDTNLYASYNRGRLTQQLALKRFMPYWQYHHHDNLHPRPEHQAWDGLIIHCDDPWWRYHYPIKAYGCHCTVTAHSEAELARMGRKPDIAPAIEWEDKIIGQRSGNLRTIRLPKGYDPGFEPTDFDNLNQHRLASVDKVLFQKMVTAPPQTAATAVLNVLSYPGAMRLLTENFKQVVDKINTAKQAAGEFNYVGVIPPEVIARLEAKELAPQSAVMAMRGEDILHALRDSKVDKGIGLPLEFWELLPEKLKQPTAVLLDTTQKDNALIFVYEQDGAKVLVKLGFKIKIRNPETRKKVSALVNLVRTGTIVTEFEGLKQYELLWGSL